MLYRIKDQMPLLGMLLVLSSCLLTGCAGGPRWGDPESGLVLSYREVGRKGIRYENSSTMVRAAGTLGARIKTETKTEAEMVFAMSSKGKRQDDLVLGITVDMLNVTVESTREGERIPATGLLTGRSFDMVLSPLGEEADLPGVDGLTYKVGRSKRNSVRPMFHTMFPDLPPRPVKVGDTWRSRDDTISDEGRLTIHRVTENVDRLVGFETIDGLECVKVRRTTSGKVVGQHETGASLRGGIEGTATWYFAYKEGILARLTMNSSENIRIDRRGSGRKIPMKRQHTVDIRLLK